MHYLCAQWHLNVVGPWTRGERLHSIISEIYSLPFRDQILSGHATAIRSPWTRLAEGNGEGKGEEGRKTPAVCPLNSRPNGNITAVPVTLRYVQYVDKNVKKDL